MGSSRSQAVPDIQGRDVHGGGFTAMPPRNLEVMRASLYDLGIQAGSETDIRKLVLAIQALDAFRKDISAHLDEWHAKAHKLMGAKELDLGAGVGLIQRATSTSDKWDNEAVFDELTKRVPRVVRPDTGELGIDGDELMALFKKGAQVSYWRKGALRSLGIDVNEVCSTSYGAKRIRIKSREGRNAVHSEGPTTGTEASGSEGV